MRTEDTGTELPAANGFSIAISYFQLMFKPTTVGTENVDPIIS
jgi:hypothetical protein